MTFRGTVRNGVVELETGANLPDGTEVRVEPASPLNVAHENSDELPALFLIGRKAVSTGLPDLATNIDHYLYGHPKVRDGQ